MRLLLKIDLKIEFCGKFILLCVCVLVRVSLLYKDTFKIEFWEKSILLQILIDYVSIV